MLFKLYKLRTILASLANDTLTDDERTLLQVRKLALASEISGLANQLLANEPEAMLSVERRNLMELQDHLLLNNASITILRLMGKLDK